jgi:hypothetical protein
MSVREDIWCMVDDRVPGDGIRRMTRYKCPVCGKIKRAERPPECDDDGVRMDPARRLFRRKPRPFA